MLTRILHNSEALCTFIDQLELKLSKPQKAHITNVADGLLVTDRNKTIAEIWRQFVSCTDPSNIADTFRAAPWEIADLREPIGRRMVSTALDQLKKQDQPLGMLVNIDDSLAIKDPYTRHLEGVDWHYDHAGNRRQRQSKQNALAYIVCNVVAADWNFTFAIRPYLRQRTVRRINRHRSSQRRLHFVSKYRLVRHILEDLRLLLPKHIPVYVHFDAWYASARLLKYIRRQGWHATCRVQANRKLNGQRIDQCALAQRHQRYVRVDIPAADGSKTTHLVRHMVGYLSNVPFEVRGLVSRRHYRDRLPVYFICTDLSLPPKRALQGYAKRWNCEVDNWYLKQRLGLGDFRLQSFEAIDKFWAVVHLTCAYLQWRLVQQSDHDLQNLADVIRLHRDEHARNWLTGACQLVLASGDIDTVLSRFLPVGR